MKVVNADSKQGNSGKQTVFIIVVIIAAVVLLLGSSGCCILKKKLKNYSMWTDFPENIVMLSYELV